VSLSIGGYGDTTVARSLPSSRAAIQRGWQTALTNPQGFAAAALETSSRLATELNLPPNEIGLDIDFEYPSVAQRTALTGLMRVLRAASDTQLSMAIPSHYNLDGYDVPVLAGIADQINVMTYANGADYGPADATTDIRSFLKLAENPGNIAVGFSTDPAENPLLATPDAVLKLRRGLEAEGLSPRTEFIWSSDGLDAPFYSALTSNP
jgi:hypothetical protein